MSCQQASRVQEDPYTFTESTPLQTATPLYKQPPQNSTSTSGNTATILPVIQAGTSLLTSNSGINHVAQQQRVSVASPKVAPIKVTLVQSPLGVLNKPRLNGATFTTCPSGTVFRTVSVSVPQATTIVQRPAASFTSSQATFATYTTTSTTRPTTVFTKPLQVQISPQQMGKFTRQVLATKSNVNVSPVTGTFQTIRIVKSANPQPQLQLQQQQQPQQQQQQSAGGRPSITPDARRYLNHSNNSLLGGQLAASPTPVAQTGTAITPTGPIIQTISPAKIRLIQPQSQGKIYIHTPNSSNSLAAATHISNPASIAALRNSLVKQNLSLLNKSPQTVTVTGPVLQATAQTKNITVLPAVKLPSLPTIPKTAISIRRTSPPTSQTSLKTTSTIVATTSTVAQVVSVPSPITVLSSPVLKIPPKIPVATIQRSKTPTTSILKPQLQQQKQQQTQTKTQPQTQAQPLTQLQPQTQPQIQSQIRSQLPPVIQLQPRTQIQTLTRPQTQTLIQLQSQLQQQTQTRPQTIAQLQAQIQQQQTRPHQIQIQSQPLTQSKPQTQSQPPPPPPPKPPQQKHTITQPQPIPVQPQLQTRPQLQTLPKQPLPKPILQDDISFTIPSFVIPKQIPKVERPAIAKPVVVPVPIPVEVPVASTSSSSPFVTPVAPTIIATTVSTNTTSTTTTTTTISSNSSSSSSSSCSGSNPSTVTPKAAPKRQTSQSSQGTKRTKRSYSKSSHHETLQRIPSVKKETGESAGGSETAKPAVPTVRFPKWKPPGAVAVPMNREWHAPGSYIYDICAPDSVSLATLEEGPLCQDFWFEETFVGSELDAEASAYPMRPPRKGRKSAKEEAIRKLLMDDDDLKVLSRDERLALKRSSLRRKAIQYWNAQSLRSIEPVRKRFKQTCKMIARLDKRREKLLMKNGGAELPKCQRPDCNQEALLATTHCYQHITDNHEQLLFQQCTAKFSDNSQCRVPVFNLNHDLILCREHAWKHDNHDKMTAEVKMLKKPAASVAAKKKMPKSATVVTSVSPTTNRTAPTATVTNAKKKTKKKKLTPLQQQLALHQQHYKQQYSSIIHSKPTLPPPAYGASSGVDQKIATQTNTFRQSGNVIYQQNKILPSNTQTGGISQTVTRNVNIPLQQQQRLSIHSYQQQTQHQKPTLVVTQSHQNLRQQQQQPPMIDRNDDLMLNFTAQQLQQQPQKQQVHQVIGNSTQDLLNICENSSAYASSEDTGVGGLSESELMVAQDVIEEIPFEIGNLNNVLSQLPPDAFNELLFSEQEQNGPTFESTQQEEEDLERALEVVGEHVKSLEDMTVESANFLGDFLDNVDDEMLDGSDICSEQMLQSPNTNEIRGLVHT
ncbi:mucin-2 [Malaya genurostris]|uniref:mucin-2 n=1 Tax=Malaya genurostris TaxID=325434 RepID=UPI0026F3B249|nr:mucin-2 [Malaya genurostris]XP_058456826.1 mucin-2 [Malaya genurostris]